ncbi:MAG TPA: serine/threonine-protein kinase [Ktedonobacterales bacterium]|nr:serine/threonine-protein kinase [Ktedonobacterales bacterium]
MGPGSGGNLVGRKLGDYQLQSLLGAGGMAEVYRALELPLGREVAVKVLPAALAADPNYVTRFRTEARRVAQLRHPNIVEVYAFNGGDRGDLLYLVMPVLSESLRDRLDDEGVLSIRESVRVVTEIASGLEVAHGVGLVHRDVKPENILLDRDGHALLTDFGIAREVPSFHRQGNAAQTLAATGLPVGTPEYMAPEQLRGGPVDQRADIYALGSVLYELLTGRVPHEADTPYEVAALVLTEPVVPPSRRNEDIPPELEQVVMKALAKIPTQRYPDMRSFALALNAAVRSGRATMRTLAGGWQRKTVRFSTAQSHDGADRWTADATTESFAVVGQPASRGLVSRYRWMLILVASAILLASVCGGGTLMALNGGLPFGGTSPASLSALSATQTARAAAIPTATPMPTETPTPVPTATLQPTATTPPPPTWLTFMPATLVLVRSSNTCTGTLTITNTSHQTLGWQWTSASPELSNYYTFTFNGKTTYGTQPLPKNMTPGLKQNETDTVLVRLSSCSTHQTRVTITAQDNLNHTYHFVIKPS